MQSKRVCPRYLHRQQHSRRSYATAAAGLDFGGFVLSRHCTSRYSSSSALLNNSPARFMLVNGMCAFYISDACSRKASRVVLPPKIRPLVASLSIARSRIFYNFLLAVRTVPGFRALAGVYIASAGDNYGTPHRIHPRTSSFRDCFCTRPMRLLLVALAGRGRVGFR